MYVTYTDSATGYVKLLISHNHGSTWRTVTLGSTTRVGTSGRIGTPVVAAYGTTVAVAWISSASGIVKFRSSPNSGLTWTGTTWLGGTAQYGSWPSIAALGTRVAVSWTGPSAMYVRVRSGSVWSPVLAVRPSAGSLHDYVFPWIGQVALNGTARVAVAFEACWAGCASTDPPSAYRSDVLWRESATNGATWARSQLVIRSGVDTDSDYLYAYLPSVIWASATNRYVMAAHWYAPNLLDNVVVRAGVGSP